MASCFDDTCDATRRLVTETMDDPLPRPVRRIARRVAATFAVELGLLATALVATVTTFRELSAAEHRVSVLDLAKHTGHDVSGRVREQYIHQAHTIIVWDRSHVEHYEVAAQEAREATERLLALPLTANERSQAGEIVEHVVRVDREFASQVLPAIDAGERARVLDLHEQTEQTVNRVVRLSEALNRALEARAAEAGLIEERLGRRAAILVIGCFVLAMLVTAATWLAIGQSILRRLSELRRGALQLAEGNLGARVRVEGSDEVSDLACTFNEMAVSLASHQQKLLESQRLAAVGQVAAGVAHEINNPLGVILGYVKLLQSGRSQADGLRIIEEEVRQCQRIVHGLLILARPAASSRAPICLSELAREVVERLTEGGRTDARTIELSRGEGPVLTLADAPALRQVVSNLLQNALEATASSGSISVAVRDCRGAVELEVWDDGAGIPDHASTKVFDPFFTTKPDGTGLGLAISQAIVRAHEGTIELVSRAGAGTRAIVRLPRVEGWPGKGEA